MLLDEGEKVLSEELTTGDFVLTREKGHTPSFRALAYRGLILTPGLNFTRLRDYAGGDYAFEFTGLSFAVTAAN